MRADEARAACNETAHRAKGTHRAEPLTGRGRTPCIAAYSFSDEWFVAAPIAAVYDVLSCPREYPDWWGDAFLAGDGDAGPAAPGKRARLLTRGRLPYRLHWELVCVEADAPRRLVSRIRGDFDGKGVWTFSEADGGTRAVLEWRVTVRKPFVRRLTPLLRPLFAWNHRWAMRRGEAAIAGLLAASSDDAEPAQALA